MKKISIAFVLGVLLLAGCENFLDTKNLTGKDTSNSPETEREMDELVTGVYLAAHDMEIDNTTNCAFMIAEIMSDDRFAGGGAEDVWGYLERFDLKDPNFLQATWKGAFYTIYRCNIVLEGIDLVKNWSSPAARDYVQGQAHFFRAYALWNLARTFGTAPLTLRTEPENLPRASADELFAQIAADFTAAIGFMPTTKLAPERGRATRWAAEAFLTRAWLFYTGCYKKDSMPVAAIGDKAAGSISRQQIIAHIDDCINNSGHDLVKDFRNLWPYSNTASKPDYAYARDNNLSWVGEGGDNVETIFLHASTPTSQGYGAGLTTNNNNKFNLYFGIRTADSHYADTFPFGAGWGFGTVNPDFWNSWPNEDIRKKGSILNMNDRTEVANYQPGLDNWTNETGFIGKKYINLTARNAAGDIDLMDRVLYGDWVINDYMLYSTQDLVTMRFADVLLMAAELKEDAAPLNRVRTRAGLTPIAAYSTEALRNERRWELAFEGLRYYDLLRWGIAGAALDRQNGVEVLNANLPAKMELGDQTAKIAATGGFMPVPVAEIDLSMGVLVQTPGW